METDEGWKSGIIDNDKIKKAERRESVTSIVSIDDRKLR